MINENTLFQPILLSKTQNFMHILKSDEKLQRNSGEKIINTKKWWENVFFYCVQKFLSCNHVEFFPNKYFFAPISTFC